MTTTYSTCYMCTSNCPITVETAAQEITNIDHPDCVRATSMIEQREHEQRQVSARIRPTVNASWRHVGISESLDHAAGRLLEVRERHGADAVAFAVGYTKEARPYLQRLAYAFGSPHYITESSCCFAAGSIAAKITLGEEYGYFLAPSRERSVETSCRLVWSNNPSESQIPYGRHHLLADAEHVPTIVVDPRRTTLAQSAELHLQARPGTDGALALGLAHVVLREELHDTEFLGRFAQGFEAYAEYVRGFNPERTSQITGVCTEDIERAARIYGSANAARITISPNATTHHSNGTQAHRAILLLAALCGNLDVPGGNRPWLDRVGEESVSRYDAQGQQLERAMGHEQFPVFLSNYPEAQGMRLAQEIESGRIRAVFSIGLNVMMWPNSRRLAHALKSLGYFSTSDFFDTPTTDLATIAFPAATHLERQALIVAGNGRVQYRPASVPPRGEALGDTELIFEMADRLGVGDQFWDGSIESSYDERLSKVGLRFDDLPKDGSSLRVERPAVRFQNYEAKGFGTPSGKVEFESSILADAGYPALPEYEEPFWSPVRTPGIAQDFPLVLTSGGRSINYTHSQGRQFESLRTREPEPFVRMNRADAESRGLVDGQLCQVSSPLSSIKMRLRVSDAIPAGVVHAPHGWAGANINELIPDDEGLDPISGFPGFKSSLCQVERV